MPPTPPRTRRTGGRVQPKAPCVAWPRVPTALAALAALAVLTCVATASAQSVPADGNTAPPARPGGAIGLGPAPDALPGVEDVGAPALGPSAPVLAAGLDYGYTGDISGAGSQRYNRLGLDLAAGLRVHRWVAFSAHSRIRADLQGGGLGGALARSELTGRVAPYQFGRFQAGGEASLLVPAAPSIGRMFSGLGGQLLGQLARQASSRLLLLGELGFRFERASNAIPDAESLPGADRVSLGVSAAHAVPMGLGAVYRLRGGLHLIGEWQWMLRVGADAPSAGQSTMWWRGGLRVPVLPELTGATLGVLAGLNSAARQSVSPAGPLQEIAPRVTLAARLSVPLGAAPVQRAEPSSKVEISSAPLPPAPVDLQVSVLDLEGQPVAGAQLSLTQEGAPQRELRADGAGQAVVLRLSPGVWQARVEAEGFEAAEQAVTVVAGQLPAPLSLRLSPVLPEGQVRGTVRAFDGEPLKATVTVEPLGARVRADVHGEFRVDVPPGDYTVTVSHPHYAPQQRPARVEEHGVTVLIVDLRRRR